jgi:hypothetical protein
LTYLGEKTKGRMYAAQTSKQRYNQLWQNKYKESEFTAVHSIRSKRIGSATIKNQESVLKTLKGR